MENGDERSAPAASAAPSREQIAELLDGYDLTQSLGLALRDASPGRVDFELRPQGALARRDGRGEPLDPGAIASVLDTVACFAMTSVNGIDVATARLSLDFLRPATGEHFTATGSVVLLGHRQAWTTATLEDDAQTTVSQAKALVCW